MKRIAATLALTIPAGLLALAAGTSAASAAPAPNPDCPKQRTNTCWTVAPAPTKPAPTTAPAAPAPPPAVQQPADEPTTEAARRPAGTSTAKVPAAPAPTATQTEQAAQSKGWTWTSADDGGPADGTGFVAGPKHPATLAFLYDRVRPAILWVAV